MSRYRLRPPASRPKIFSAEATVLEYWQNQGKRFTLVSQSNVTIEIYGIEAAVEYIGFYASGNATDRPSFWEEAGRTRVDDAIRWPKRFYHAQAEETSNPQAQKTGDTKSMARATENFRRNGAANDTPISHPSYRRFGNR